MEDVLTEIPPPSRFFQEDLNNFTSPSPPLPSPFLLLSKPYADKPIKPSLLVIAMSSPSLYLFHKVSSKTLIGSLILPEMPLTGNTVTPSLGDKSCNIYAINNGGNLTLLVAVKFSLKAERCHAVAKLLIGDKIVPERVLILDSVQSRNFRGRLSSDEALALKLETSSERKDKDGVLGKSSLLRGVEYFPSGSMVDGLAAALLSRCQIRNIKGTLCVSWPELGTSVAALVKSLLVKDVLPGLDFSSNVAGEDDYMKLTRNKDHAFDSEMYT